MENFKGTKGKWVYYEKYQVINDEKGYGIAQEYGILNSKEWEANAKLIAASKDLLEALVNIKNHAEEYGLPYKYYQEAINAINKATK